MDDRRLSVDAQARSDGSHPPWPRQIVASHHTLSGVAPRSTSRFSVRERLEAAGAAGYDGIGLAYYDFVAQLERGETLASLQGAVDETGVPVIELEILYGWNSVQQGAASRDAEARLCEMAALFGARHMNVAVSQAPGTRLDLDEVVAQFRALCGRASDAGLVVALEFQPLTAITDLAMAWDIVCAAGCENGGILLDSWHFFRGRPDFALLRSISSDRIVAVQINDAAEQPIGTLWEDTTRRRLLPGTGSFALKRLVEDLRAMRVDCPLSVEIIADDQMAVDVIEAARRSHAATASLLSRGAPQRTRST